MLWLKPISKYLKTLEFISRPYFLYLFTKSKLTFCARGIEIIETIKLVRNLDSSYR